MKRQSIWNALLSIGLFCFGILPAVANPAGNPSADLPTDSPIVKDWLKQDGKTEADAGYLEACQKRRNERLKTLRETYPKIVFTKHFDLGGSHYAYTEAQSDAQAERNFRPGSAICLLELGNDNDYHERTLLEDANGVIRDPAVTFDGKKIVFAWKKSDRLDDYHLYDYDVATGAVRQLTFGLGYADYEPCPLPNGDIVFNSTRCVQVVDCWWTEVSNLYRCDKDGNFLRRLSFDQVHTNYPSLMEDGRIVYTRWDYNDRGQIFPQGVFQMNADGTAQTEYYGNNSWFPTTLMHTRAIPNGGGKTVSIFSGHHTNQYGKLGIVDPTKGRQENTGTQLIAPIRKTNADRVDAWGQQGDRFSHPYPINEREFIVSYNHEYLDMPPLPSDATAEEKKRRWQQEYKPKSRFDLYWINEDGDRELLAADTKTSCNQPFPLIARKPVPLRDAVPTVADDPEKEYGTYTMQDVYFGPGMEGVERGAAKTLRVIALDFRSVGIGQNGNNGPSGGALVSTPVAVSHGTWDVKIPLGDVPIEEDGSASFMVPARTPVYFQVLDENGHCIQTMRSWSTLQPGETFSCVGCHEDKNATVQQRKTALAQRKPPAKLQPPFGNADGKPRGFSFAKEIQPILDRHCIQCHHNDAKKPPYEGLRIKSTAGKHVAMDAQTASRAVAATIREANTPWHYRFDAPSSDWMTEAYFNKTAVNLPQSKGAFGSRPGHAFPTEWKGQKLWAWTTFDLPDDWTPQPLLLRYFHDEDVVLYVNGKKIFSATNYIVDYSYVFLSKKDTESFRPGRNVLAAHIIDTGGGRGFDLELSGLKPEFHQNARELLDNGMDVAEADLRNAFSLKGDAVLDEKGKRYWSRSYLNLTNAESREDSRSYSGRQTPVVNWINVQDVPSMLPPYKAGAARSQLPKMFDPRLALDGKTHNDVKLSREERDKLAAWIDLLVPFCGDYKEANAWDERELAKFEYYENKKKAMHEYDRDNLLKFVSYKLERKSPEPVRTTENENPYRNLALNPTAVDVREGETPRSYPAASSNSVCRGDKAFAASNCIDGKTDNKGHGKDFPSWGPEQNVADLWWKVDFGKPVRTDQIAITLRADFPHDTHWKACTVECSNGFKHRISLQKTSDRQVFRFAPQRIAWLKLTNFEAAAPGWAALSEVEVLGVDSVSRSYVAPGTEEK